MPLGLKKGAKNNYSLEIRTKKVTTGQQKPIVINIDENRALKIFLKIFSWHEPFKRQK